ncbi:MAG TPA: helix-turn-helix domain-containing protein [Candidatus Paceibacterota bacterium]|nr:helix-turn-helix domain-containing protein [Candidatus Paceibacterota bacterium]
MARKIEKQKALELREQGKSYSEIKSILCVNKSTLSGWLKDLPLSAEKIAELRDNNPKRIENFRKTMAAKKEARLSASFEKASRDVGKLSDRDIFIGGLFLYWGEGSKRDKGGISFTNTNPDMIKYFVRWLVLMGFRRDQLKVNLHLYSDMNAGEAINYWSKELKIKRAQFRRPYIKKTESKNIKYKSGFGHGTCSVILEKQEMNDYILSALKYLAQGSDKM